ncbi:MAG: molybdenum cofactor guanylyltransferase [Nitrospira sp. SB0662_bin_26]|nr:molybdenum cofactor guanylyltransferase [Nitrospira sp. SB0662_bin_26]
MIGEVSGVVLAGGKSKRMGMDKRHLSVHGKPLLDRVTSVLLELFPEVLLVLAEEDISRQDDRMRIVTDLIPDCAAVGGLYTGLYHSRYPRVFVVACDMPFINPAVIELFLQKIDPTDIVLAQLVTGLQPLHGLYSKQCLPILKEMIDARDLRLQNIVDKQGLTVHRVSEAEIKRLDPQLLSFLNLNSPADLELANKISPG